MKGFQGFALGWTSHHIGVPFHIFETSRKIKPLGAGINLQPSAVRELIDLGLHQVLMGIGVETRDYRFYTKTGRKSGPNRADATQDTSGHNFLFTAGIFKLHFMKRCWNALDKAAFQQDTD